MVYLEYIIEAKQIELLSFFDDFSEEDKEVFEHLASS